MIYLVIFIAKMVEVTFATLRSVLINRGEKIKGSLVGLLEVTIWIILVSTVVSNISSDWMKAVVYCIAFAVGNYAGSTLESKLAIGTSCATVIFPEEIAEQIIEELRTKGFGITTMLAKGLQSESRVAMIYLKRKRVQELYQTIKMEYPQAVITITTVSEMHNGFLIK